MIAEERAPLTIIGDGRRTIQNSKHIVHPAFFECHINARHDGEVESHVKFVAVTEIRTNIFRPLIRFTQ